MTVFACGDFTPMRFCGNSPEMIILCLQLTCKILDCEPVKRKNSPDAEFQQQVHTS